MKVSIKHERYDGKIKTAKYSNVSKIEHNKIETMITYKPRGISFNCYSSFNNKCIR